MAQVRRLTLLNRGSNRVAAKTSNNFRHIQCAVQKVPIWREILIHSVLTMERTGSYNPRTDGPLALGATACHRSSSMNIGEMASGLGRKLEASTALRLSVKGRRQEFGASAPGCLTTESEERETWTARSLRTCCMRRAIFKGGGQEETWRSIRFKQGTSLIA